MLCLPVHSVTIIVTYDYHHLYKQIIFIFFLATLMSQPLSQHMKLGTYRTVDRMDQCANLFAFYISLPLFIKIEQLHLMMMDCQNFYLYDN